MNPSSQDKLTLKEGESMVVDFFPGELGDAPFEVTIQKNKARAAPKVKAERDEHEKKSAAKSAARPTAETKPKAKPKASHERQKPEASQLFVFSDANKTFSKETIFQDKI